VQRSFLKHISLYCQQISFGELINNDFRSVLKDRIFFSLYSLSIINFICGISFLFFFDVNNDDDDGDLWPSVTIMSPKPFSFPHSCYAFISSLLSSLPSHGHCLYIRKRGRPESADYFASVDKHSALLFADQ